MDNSTEIEMELDGTYMYQIILPQVTLIVPKKPLANIYYLLRLRAMQSFP